MKKILTTGLFILILSSSIASPAEAKSTIKGYRRSSGVSVRSYTRYKADGYKFNNYVYRPDRGYRK